MIMKKKLRFFVVSVFLTLVAACSGGGATVSVDESNVVVGSLEGSEFAAMGSVTIMADTDDYELSLTFGESSPVSIVASESGEYEIQTTSDF